MYFQWQRPHTFHQNKARQFKLRSFQKHVLSMASTFMLPIQKKSHLFPLSVYIPLLSLCAARTRPRCPQTMEKTMAAGTMAQPNVALHQSVVLDVVVAISPGGSFVLSVVLDEGGMRSNQCRFVAKADVSFDSISKRKRTQEKKNSPVFPPTFELTRREESPMPALWWSKEKPKNIQSRSFDMRSRDVLWYFGIDLVD